MARQEVGTEAMETYRHLSKKIAAGTGPGDLWDVLDDPQPQLRALHHYATVTSDILSRMAARPHDRVRAGRGGRRCPDPRVQGPR